MYIITSHCEEVLVLCLGGLDPLVVDDQIVGNHQLIVRIICNTNNIAVDSDSDPYSFDTDPIRQFRLNTYHSGSRSNPDPGF